MIKKPVSISTLPDDSIIKRTLKTRTKFKIITKGDFGVVIHSQTKGSKYSDIMKPSAKVYAD